MRRPVFVLGCAVVATVLLASTPAAGTQTASNETVITLQSTPGADTEDIRAAAGTLEQRLNLVGQANATVTVDGPNVTVRTTGAITNWMLERGAVRLLATYPGPNGTQNRTLLTHEAIRSVGSVRERDGQVFTPVTVRDTARENVTRTLDEAGFLAEGVAHCTTESDPGSAGYCLVTTVDGDPIANASVSPALADAIRSGEFEGEFLVTFTTQAQATRVTRYLRSGPLETPLFVMSVEAAGDVTAATTDTTDSNESGPGFTIVATLVALLTLALRRADRQH